MWYVTLGWHAIEFAETSAISELYFWFRFRPHYRSRHVILQSPKFYPNRTRKKWHYIDFQDGGSQPSWIVGSNNGFFEKPNYITSYRSTMNTVALNCLVCEKIAFFEFWRQTDRQTDKQTDGLHRCTKPLERRLNKCIHIVYMCLTHIDMFICFAITVKFPLFFGQ